MDAIKSLIKRMPPIDLENRKEAWEQLWEFYSQVTDIAACEKNNICVFCGDYCHGDLVVCRECMEYHQPDIKCDNHPPYCYYFRCLECGSKARNCATTARTTDDLEVCYYGCNPNK